MAERCAVCGRGKAGDEEEAVELLLAVFVHRGVCLVRWVEATSSQRAAWAARGRSWTGLRRSRRRSA